MSDTDLTQQPAGATLPLAGYPALEVPVVKRIVPVKRRLRVSEIWRDVPVIKVLATRDFKIKYKQSLLGPLWLVFQPLALLAAFFVAFQGLADVESSGVPYVVFALVGLSAWAFFQASLTIGTASVVSNMQLVRFTPCPRLAFPVAALIASLPAFGVTALGALTATAVTGQLSGRILLLPLGLVWLFLLTAGVVAITSALTVRFRDMLSAMPFLLQVGLFLAPVGYPLSELSPTVRAIVDLNPLTGLIEACRWMMIADYQPSFEPIALSLILTPLLVVVGWLFFTRKETTMADEI
jgi:lipopolysaccharide transport system permease protein